MRTTWTQRTNGEWFTVPNKRLYRIKCCDCGLVHDLSFRVRKDKLQIKASRNERSTAALRRVKAIRTPQADKEQK